VTGWKRKEDEGLWNVLSKIKRRMRGKFDKKSKKKVKGKQRERGSRNWAELQEKKVEYTPSTDQKATADNPKPTYGTERNEDGGGRIHRPGVATQKHGETYTLRKTYLKRNSEDGKGLAPRDRENFLSAWKRVRASSARGYGTERLGSKLWKVGCFPVGEESHHRTCFGRRRDRNRADELRG